MTTTTKKRALGKYPNIKKFLSKNKGFRFVVGEVGFGRPCVGIVEAGTDEYVAYRVYSDDGGYAVVAECSAAWGPDRPDNAYHKHDCFAVLIPDVDPDLGPTDAQKHEAVAALDRWLGGVIAKGYRIFEYLESGNSLGALIAGERRKLRAVIDKGGIL